MESPAKKQRHQVCDMVVDMEAGSTDKDGGGGSVEVHGGGQGQQGGGGDVAVPVA